jgi:phage/plasmid-associated DNA primase
MTPAGLSTKTSLRPPLSTCADALRTPLSKQEARLPMTALAPIPNNSTVPQNFMKDMFGPVTEAPVWIQSLGNPGSDEKSRHLATRDLADIEAFVKRWDHDGRGAYFCVSTMKGIARTKENASEIIGLHADIDFKDTDDTPDAILAKLHKLRFIPSRIHATGNGYHCFWLFKESAEASPEYQARYEAALKLLCDVVGGDQSVTHAAALMRLPGTHNTKHGRNVLVEVIRESNARYELDDLEDWLAEQSPVILRKNRPAIVTASNTLNPYLAAAMARGFKPSINVENRLASMSYMAGGDAAIHATQLAVSASLLRSGVAIDDAVELILDATKGAATGYGERWNWVKEEKAIRRMCTDWIKKHPGDGKAAHSGQNQTNVRELVSKISHDENRGASLVTDGTVVALAPKRAQKKMSSGTPVHVVLGDAILATLRDRGEEVLVTKGEVWRYQSGLWAVENHEQSWLNAEIEGLCQAFEIDSTIKIVNEARQWVLRQPDLIRQEADWDSHGKVPTQSGLLDVATMTLEPAHPRHLATWRIECVYDPDATCPWWEIMLEDFFGDRPAELRAATISTVQEVLGAGLLENKSRALTRALILEGPSEAGKTRILDVIGGLFSDRPIATPLDVLGATHGLMEFRRRAPWVLHEAFNAGQWHMSSIVKSILTGDPVQINVKNGALTTQRIKAPVFWATNHPPQFKEATKAIVNRLIVIHCRVVFDPKKPVGAAAEAQRRGFSEPSELILETEMPGLLNWAVVGLRRALDRGFMALTPEMAATLEAVRGDSNLVTGFIDECIEFGTSSMVSVADFCAAFAVWWAQEKGEDRRLPSNDSIGRAMSALGDDRIAIDGTDMRDNSRRYYGGLHLNGQGLDFWDGAHSEGMAKGKTAQMSANRSSVNRNIPAGWKDRPAVVRLNRSSGDASFGRSVTHGLDDGANSDTTPKF